MAHSFFLNACDTDTVLVINGGADHTLKSLNLQNANPDQTLKVELGADAGPDKIGRGNNEVRVTNAGTTRIYNIELSAAVIVSLDVQFLIFTNGLEAKNTLTTDGFIITEVKKEMQAMVEAQALVQNRPPPQIHAFGVEADPVSFTKMGDDDKGTVYAASNNGPGNDGVAVTFFYLFAGNDTVLDNLTLQESFDAVGAYVFSDEAADAAVLLDELGTALSRDGNFSRLAWRLSAGEYDIIIGTPNSLVATDVTLPIGNWQLFLRRNAGLSLDTDAQALRLTKAANEDSIEVQIVDGVLAPAEGTKPDTIVMPLIGDHRGSLTFAWDWSHYALESSFGGNFRIFYGSTASDAEMAQYPLFAPAPAPGRFDTPNLFFHAYFQPLAPLDDQRTRLALDLEQQNALTSQYVISTSNASVAVAPAANLMRQKLTAGFGFARNSGTQSSSRYLCPVGEFELVGLARDQGLELASSTNDRIQLRGGLAGTEYLLVKPGDHLCFEGDMSAFAKDYQPGKGAPTYLDATLTTAWARVLRKDPITEQAVEVVDTSYCAQSSDSTYFGADLSETPLYEYPIAVGASLVQFDGKGQETVPPEEDEIFPLMPYGGVYFEDSDKGITNPNPDLDSHALEGMERQIIARSRRARLAPFFNTNYGPIFFDTSTNTAFDGGYARTPLGLLAKLNTVGTGTPPAGSINEIILAQSPQNNAQFLALGPSEAEGVANPIFTNAVLDEKLFLVATDASKLAPFANEIQLGDFSFQINLGNTDNEAIALFKFVPGVSLRALTEDIDAWTAFTGDASNDAVRERIREYIKVAEAGGEIFTSFLAMLDDKNWNGVLFLNSPLDYSALPLDIQILLGGINGPLRAHHFGVTVNRLDETESEVSIDSSSLFSVINYKAEFVGPTSDASFEYPNFQVLLLNVRYANSKLAVFDSKIAFSIDTLYGSKATLSVAPEVAKLKETGTIEIDGVYTLHEDGTGSLVFSTQEKRSFTFGANDAGTVLTAQSIADATLVPITSNPGTGDCKTLAISAFRISGLLAFRDDIGGDLFSFGEVEDQMPIKGLSINGYSFAITTCIQEDNTAHLLGGIETDLSGLKVDQIQSQARDLSFNRTLPSTIEALDYTPSGLKPTQNGEWQVKIEGAKLTGAPVYSLRFEVPLGMFGALSALNSDLTATIHIGWNPAETNPEKNVGVVLRFPPEIAGPKGFNFNGILSSSFEYVQIDRLKLTDTKVVSILRLVHYQGMLLSLFFNYNTEPKDLGLFGFPEDPGGSNSLFFIGKSVDKDWVGPVVSVTLEKVPVVYLLRAYEVKTDPTNPNVIDEVFNKLNPFKDMTVGEFVSFINANSSLYNSDAGIAFGIKFDYKSLALTAVLHDSSFYGAQIKLTPEKKKKDEKDKDGGKDKPQLLTVENSSIRDVVEAAEALALNQNFAVLAEGDGEEKKDDGFLSKVKDFTFTIIYRKVSDEVGVFSADIYLNLGQINMGAVQLQLPNFSISIWTNGDWRFAIGWPFNGSGAHPITIQFQAGPIPVIGKAGFYLAKLSSAAAPDQFGPDFGLIWSFGVGLAAGVGKEFKQGPLKAGASLILGITVEGFLASFDGTFTSNGVDYWWWGVSISLTGNVFGKVDFKIIAVEVSLTITITVAFAIETKHKTPLKLTAEVVAKASIKIVFIKISFSFKAKLDILSTEFGSGAATAKLSGPTPKAVSLDALNAGQMDTRMAMMMRGAAPMYLREPKPSLMAFEAEPVPVHVSFALQPTATSADGVVWTPQGVATLLIETGDSSSAFGTLNAGLARWLLAEFGKGEDFHRQLISTADKLDAGAFEPRVAEALSQCFVFDVAGFTATQDTAYVSFPMPESLALIYNGGPVQGAADAAPRTRFGAQDLPENYTDMVLSYFAGTPLPEQATTQGDSSSVVALLFDEFFVMLAQQLVQQMIETGAPDLDTSLKELNLGDLGGFVSRFLMGGLRLPDPQAPQTLKPLYVLSGQQFALHKTDDNWVLSAQLQATSETPAWIKVATDTNSALDPAMVHTTGPSAAPWNVTQLAPLSEGPTILALNNIVNWTDGSGAAEIINTLPESALHAVRDTTKVGLHLRQKMVGGQSDADQQVDLADPGTPWESAAALALPVRLAAIPDPEGDDGAILPNVFSLLGTDEANRALLQALLDDPAADVQAIDVLSSAGRGNWAATKVPSVLVRTDLSTARGAQEAVQGAGTGGPNYAKLAEGGEQFRIFLRLLWEVSVVHSSGFYLQIDGLKPEMFAQGPADMMVLVRFGALGATVEAKPYQNALVGAAPAAGQAIFSTLVDKQGVPMPSYSATYNGGSVGWAIEWADAPAEADAQDADFLRGLYQLVSYRVTSINGTAIDQNWSRPVTATDTSAPTDTTTTWRYQSVFAAAGLVGGDNRYAAVGGKLDVAISVEDVFGNTLPPSLSPNAALDVMYNDALLGLGDWAGTYANYLVSAEGGLNLGLHLGFDTSSVLDPEGHEDPELLKTVTGIYAQLADQLADTLPVGHKVTAGIDTHGILAADILRDTGPADKTVPLVTALSSYVADILGWLRATDRSTPPEGAVIKLPLKKDHPANWSGDLQELGVDLLLERDGVPDAITAKSPQVAHSASPIQPVEETSDDKTDPSGLTTFALEFETAYYPFDGKTGTVKVATGTNSDMTSLSFGKRSIWLQRWGVDAGTEVEILNDEANQPVFYAPPPLSTQLITRKVDGLREYSGPDTFDLFDRVFSSIDMDLWAAQFLRTVETVFAPTMAPNVADNSGGAQELYNPFVSNKQSLAGTLSSRIDYVYDEPEGTGSPSTAQETWRQSLLRSLENDYGFSTLTQLKTMVHLNGEIEPDGDPNHPPYLYGAVQAVGQPQDDKLPYALTPAILPLVEGENWLNFLTSARNPEAQRAFTLDLNYEVNQVEHLRDGGASDRGYVPSNWLTFVLQQNPEALPQGEDNTLTQRIGSTRIPIPLRTYPPLPQLRSADAQVTKPKDLAEALTWNARVRVERSAAAQDTLVLSMSFNEPIEEHVTPAMQMAVSEGREPPVDLFAALARFVTEYPQLQSDIEKLTQQGPPEAVAAVEALSNLIGDTALVWSKWVPPVPAHSGLEEVRALTALAAGSPDLHAVSRETWMFSIQDKENSEVGELEVTMDWSRDEGTPPWPQITGHKFESVDGETATYSSDNGKRQTDLELIWPDLFVLNYQSMRPSVYTLRNKNLALPPNETNPEFVFRTETVTWATPVVPLITAPDLIELKPPSTPDTSLEVAVQSMLTQLITAPPDSRQNGSDILLDYETSIDYRYQVIANKDSSAYANLPVFLVAGKVTDGEEAVEAQSISKNLAKWHDTTGASAQTSSLRFRLTIYSSLTDLAEDRLPLVQFQELVIPIRNDEGWW